MEKKMYKLTRTEKELNRILNLHAKSRGTQQYSDEEFARMLNERPIRKQFPYCVFVEGDTNWLSLVVDYQLYKMFGFKHGECFLDNCPHADKDPESPLFVAEKIFKTIQEGKEWIFEGEFIGANVNPDLLALYDIAFFLGFEYQSNWDKMTPKDSKQVNRILRQFSKDQMDQCLEKMAAYDRNKIVSTEFLWTLEHSHVGKWAIGENYKTGYDYVFCEYCFKNSLDAILFKMCLPSFRSL